MRCRNVIGRGGLCLAAALCVLALSPGFALAERGTLTPPSSFTGTLTVTPGIPAGMPQCFYGFEVKMRAGQTLVATLTTGPGVTGVELGVGSNIGNYHLVAQSSDTSVSALSFAAQTSQTAWLSVYSATPGTFTVDLAEAGRMPISLAGLRAPKKAKRKKSFIVMTTLASYNGFVCPVRFFVERKSRRHWRTYGSAAAYDVFEAGTWTFAARLKLPRGTFRVRARFKDAAHPSPYYNRWKTVVVR